MRDSVVIKFYGQNKNTTLRSRKDYQSTASRT
jgi:hypothetical protein